jgi:hypothetical protein
MTQVWPPVAQVGDQRPYVGRIKTPMDENGQFVLLLRSARNKPWDQLVSKEYASIRYNVATLPVATKKKLAVFPMYFSKTMHLHVMESQAYTGTKSAAITVLKEVLANNRDFNPTYSYYELSSKLNYRKIGTDILSEKVIEELWRKEDGKPNIELITKIGKKLDVDAVFISNCRLDNIETYLIDIQNNQVFSKRTGYWYGTGYSQVPEHIRDFFSTYKDAMVE